MNFESLVAKPRGFKMKLLGALSMLLLILSSCSTASVRLLPGEKGLNKVFARDIELEGAEEAAHKAAIKYCEDKSLHPVFLKQKSAYTGKMSEASRKSMRATSRAVSLIPGAGLIGSMGEAATNDRDYEAGLLFKCSNTN